MRFKEYLNESNVNYSAVIIDDASKSSIINHPMIKSRIGETHEIIAHHMTIKLGSIEGTSHEQRIGKTEEFEATHVGTYGDGALVAVLVNGISNNKQPHITISLDRSTGIKPKDSNLITNWKELIPPIFIKGAVLEI